MPGIQLQIHPRPNSIENHVTYKKKRAVKDENFRSDNIYLIDGGHLKKTEVGIEGLREFLDLIKTTRQVPVITEEDPKGKLQKKIINKVLGVRTSR